jgi:PIN domain nuclease of toxin-antitoxin system
MSLKKLECDKNIQEIEEYILSKDYEVMNVSFSHLKTLFDLPKLHGDPFDRLLIAQAISENLTIISADKQLKSYPVNTTW